MMSSMIGKSRRGLIMFQRQNNSVSSCFACVRMMSSQKKPKLLFEDDPFTSLNVPMTPRELKAARGKTKVQLFRGKTLATLEERLMIDQLILGNEMVLVGMDENEQERLKDLAKNDRLNFLSTPENTRKLLDPESTEAGYRAIDMLNLIRVFKAAEDDQPMPVPLRSPTDVPKTRRENEFIRSFVRIIKNSPDTDVSKMFLSILDSKDLTLEQFAKLKDKDLGWILIPPTESELLAATEVHVEKNDPENPVHLDFSEERANQIEHDMKIEKFYTEKHRNRNEDTKKIYRDAGFSLPISLDFEVGLDSDRDVYGFPSRPIFGFREFIPSMVTSLIFPRDGLRFDMHQGYTLGSPDPREINEADRKIKIVLDLDNLNETDQVRECFIEIIGARYNKEKNRAVFTSHEFPTPDENKAECIRRVRNSLVTARKMAKQFGDCA